MSDRWEWKFIEDVAQVVNGGTPKTKVPEFWDGENLWITPAEMGNRETPYLGESRRTLSSQGLDNCSASLVPEKSVILSTRAPIGHLVINTVPMAFNQGCRALVTGDRLNYKFLYYFLFKNVDTLNDLGTGTTFKELAAGKLKKLRIPVPPLAEQKRIVAILDESFAGIDAAIVNTEKNLANARELFEICTSEVIFGDPEKRGWQRKHVFELALPEKGAIRTGPFGSQLRHGEFVESGVAVLGIDNAVNNKFMWGKKRYISEEKYQQLKRYTVRPGDVLITIMGTCGRCAIVPEDIPAAINTKHLCCISLDRGLCLPEFLHAYFLYHPVARRFLESRAKGSIMAGLNMGIIKDLPVWLPSLEEQKEIVERVGELGEETLRLRSVYEQKKLALLELKQSFLQKAFSGELAAENSEKELDGAVA
ncbi:restriction endonuclease subunit S [Marinobacter pelagius]|uniref:Type I restriction enzyme, S subunit n=1 Tax=Marinobacter pelagius TaxID=379482 RepID=A0A1I4XI98_9GAMM|nr:restriction endonuclease subunit S [Marinobacter pelagius]SFN25326.1 type I restriction enzyme, S subunit [Marinobacter pelagius]